MNKAALAEIVQSITQGTKTQSEEIMNAVTEAIVKTLKKGDDVAWAGLGMWTTKKRAARTARNPKTGEAVQVAATRVVKFKVSKALKDVVAA
jgi:DNA-binding protein HU-beta